MGPLERLLGLQARHSITKRDLARLLVCASRLIWTPDLGFPELETLVRRQIQGGIRFNSSSVPNNVWPWVHICVISESIFITSLADSLSVSNDTGHCTVNSGLCPGPVSAMSVMVLCHTPTLNERDCVQMTSTRYKARRWGVGNWGHEGSENSELSAIVSRRRSWTTIPDL